MGDNPILVLLCIFGILWFVFSLFFIVTLHLDIKLHKQNAGEWRYLYESLHENTMGLAFLLANGIKPDNRAIYLEDFKRSSYLQLIACHCLKLQSENEKLKTHIEMLLTGRD